MLLRSCGMLHEWIQVLARTTDAVEKFYEPWAFMSSGDTTANAPGRRILAHMVSMLSALAAFPFALSMNYEVQSVRDVVADPT